MGVAVVPEVGGGAGGRRWCLLLEKSATKKNVQPCGWRWCLKLAMEPGGGNVLIKTVTVYKAHGPVQHGLSRIMTTAKTTAGTIPYAGTGTVPREVVPDW